MEKILRNLRSRQGFKNEIVQLENLFESFRNTSIKKIDADINPKLAEEYNRFMDLDFDKFNDIGTEFFDFLRTDPDILNNLSPIWSNGKEVPRCSLNDYKWFMLRLTELHVLTDFYNYTHLDLINSNHNKKRLYSDKTKISTIVKEINDIFQIQ